MVFQWPRTDDRPRISRLAQEFPLDWSEDEIDHDVNLWRFSC